MLCVLNQNQKIWNLELCHIVLPSLEQLLSSHQTEYTLIGCSSLKIILNHFGSVIKDIIRKHPLAKDIPGQERQKRCLDCFHQIQRLCSIITERRCLSESSEVGHRMRELEFIVIMLDEPATSRCELCPLNVWLSHLLTNNLNFLPSSPLNTERLSDHCSDITVC